MKTDEADTSDNLNGRCFFMNERKTPFTIQLRCDSLGMLKQKGKKKNVTGRCQSPHLKHKWIKSVAPYNVLLTFWLPSQFCSVLQLFAKGISSAERNNSRKILAHQLLDEST